MHLIKTWDLVSVIFHLNKFWRFSNNCILIGTTHSSAVQENGGTTGCHEAKGGNTGSDLHTFNLAHKHIFSYFFKFRFKVLDNYFIL